MLNFELHVGAPSGAVLHVFEYETLTELEDSLRELLAPTGGPVWPEISFIPFRGSPPPFTVPEAFGVAVEVLSAATGKVRCMFASERAKDHASRQLPGSDRPNVHGTVGSIQVEVSLGDITRARADAIVNASNTLLKLGSGVSGSIRRAASNPDGLQAAMLALAPIATGAVVLTSSWLPNAPLMLHAATASGGEDVVRRALLNVLEVCAKRGIEKVAVPALGCGTGGLAIERFGEIAREALIAHAGDNPKRVTVVLYDAGSFSRFCEHFLPAGS